jgi:hypothetical protein
MTKLFDAASLTFAAYWSDPVLACDYRTLVVCGRVQQWGIEAGQDTPAVWWAHAARTYAGDDEQAKLARLACLLVSARLAGGQPS